MDIIFHELTGINSILIFSNTILKNITNGGLSPRLGTCLIGMCNFLSAVASIGVIRTFGRRPLMLIGHVGIAVCHCIIGVLTILEINYGVLVFICLFIIIYEQTTGPIAWFYAAETCCDVTLGVCMYTLYFTVFILTLVTEPLMNSVLQP